MRRLEKYFQDVCDEHWLTDNFYHKPQWWFIIGQNWAKSNPIFSAVKIPYRMHNSNV